ncbi:D-alanyl-lipoteichoic acid biosynthesis protein DltD [Clostridium sulfidigenes]|uniref:D-alanyl-lipoteichoic acid biosynthesis protein DltD n=1 Tax=Clostridium sulfidigenes TaxID=318464 RepID=UPI003F89D169
MKKSFIIVIPIIVTAIFISIFNLVINSEIDQLKNDKDLSGIKHAYGGSIKKNGTKFRDISIENDDLMLLGSSELSSKVPQNPRNLFPFSGANYDVTTYGVAYIQSFQHATGLGSIEEYPKDSKLAILVSLQWFMQEGGIESEKFLSGFSDIQFYKFLNNPKISKENKRYLAKRVTELLGDSDIFKEEKLYAQLFLQENNIDKMLYCMSLPYFRFKENLLDTRYNIDLLRELKKLPNENDEDKINNFDFEEQYAIAEKQGRDSVTNNKFYVDDSYYDKYLKEKVNELDGIYGKINLINSVEYNDFNFFLSLCDDLNIRPYVILVGVNGWYYDYTGITEKERNEFYNKLENIALEKKFDVLNLSEYEYEKYYLSDVMHLGWKGWISVTEGIYKYFGDK